ncbi:MAG: hypothetical protein Q4D80_04955 [Pseudomonadota bacterium]|nr:hypothetical protein [Pseudomonadota bacterium]
MENRESLAFLREYFRIPANKKIGWGIIEECLEKNGKTEYRPGVYIENSRVYLDIAKRRFFTQMSSPLISRCIHPAVKTRQGLACCYTAKDNKNLSIVRSRTYITDIFYPAIYSKELEENLLV